MKKNERSSSQASKTHLKAKEKFMETQIYFTMQKLVY
jgi:hypothetical protein